MAKQVDFHYLSERVFRLQVLHGDIVQSQRETTLKAFRDGRLRVLIATDVAARGLDIKGVELVINSQPPSKNFTDRADVETYVHRSGRTGRAGSKGVCITLFKHNQKGILDEIAQATNNTFKRIGAPQVSTTSVLRLFSRAHSVQHSPLTLCELPLLVLLSKLGLYMRRLLTSSGMQLNRQWMNLVCTPHCRL